MFSASLRYLPEWLAYDINCFLFGHYLFPLITNGTELKDVGNSVQLRVNQQFPLLFWESPLLFFSVPESKESVFHCPFSIQCKAGGIAVPWSVTPRKICCRQSQLALLVQPRGGMVRRFILSSIEMKDWLLRWYWLRFAYDFLISNF